MVGRRCTIQAHSVTDVFLYVFPSVPAGEIPLRDIVSHTGYEEFLL